MTELTKQYTVVYKDDKTIISLNYNGGVTYPGVDDNYAEFDTQEELEQFILDNELVES